MATPARLEALQAFSDSLEEQEWPQLYIEAECEVIRQGWTPYELSRRLRKSWGDNRTRLPRMSDHLDNSEREAWRSLIYGGNGDPYGRFIAAWRARKAAGNLGRDIRVRLA